MSRVAGIYTQRGSRDNYQGVSDLDRQPISLIGKVWSDISGNSQINKQLAAQKEENEKTREYNSMLADKENAANLAQWYRENSYNTPSAQKARIEAAGLNADLMYSGGGVSNTAASSPSMTAGAAASPMDWSSLANKKSPYDAIDRFLDAQLKQAQINKLNSETQGQEVQNDILSSDRKFRDALNRGQLDTMYSKITLEHQQGEESKQRIDESKQNVKESQARIMSINAQIEQVGVNMKKMANDIKNDNARLDLERIKNSAQIKEIASRYDLNEVQRNQLIDSWDYLVRNYDDGHSISILEQGRLEIENGQLVMHGKMTYGAMDKDMTAYENCMKFLNQLTTFASPFIKKH